MKFKLLLAMLLLGSLSFQQVQASILYASEHAGTIYSIDSSDGTYTTLGSSGHNAPGLAYNGLTDTLYLNSINGLYSLDKLNGASTFIGSFGLSLTGLTFNSDFSKLLAISDSTNQLVEIDLLTGVAIEIGALVNTDSFWGVVDLATNSLGEVFGMGLDGDLYNINVTTGEASFIASTNVELGFTSISFDKNDTLFGITTCCDASIPDDSLMTINTVTGETILIGGDIGYDVRGLAFGFDASPVAVTAPTSLTLMIISLIGVGFLRRLKKIDISG